GAAGASGRIRAQGGRRGQHVSADVARGVDRGVRAGNGRRRASPAGLSGARFARQGKGSEKREGERETICKRRTRRKKQKQKQKGPPEGSPFPRSPRHAVARHSTRAQSSLPPMMPSIISRLLN